MDVLRLVNAPANVSLSLPSTVRELTIGRVHDHPVLRSHDHTLLTTLRITQLSLALSKLTLDVRSLTELDLRNTRIVHCTITCNRGGYDTVDWTFLPDTLQTFVLNAPISTLFLGLPSSLRVLHFRGYSVYGWNLPTTLEEICFDAVWHFNGSLTHTVLDLSPFTSLYSLRVRQWPLRLLHAPSSLRYLGVQSVAPFHDVDSDLYLPLHNLPCPFHALIVTQFPLLKLAQNMNALCDKCHRLTFQTYCTAGPPREHEHQTGFSIQGIDTINLSHCTRFVDLLAL